MGKGAKLPTPEASPSPMNITMTQHRDSVLTTADQNVFTEMLNARRRHSFAKAQVAPTMLTQSALNSRFPSRGASPTEFHPKLQDNVTTLAGPLSTQSQLFPQRRRSSLAGNSNIMAGRAYELVPGFGKQGNLDGSHRRQLGRRSSSRKESLRGQRSFLDSSSVSQKLEWIDLQMRVPEYLENLRGLSRQARHGEAEEPSSALSRLPELGQKRRSTLVLNEDRGEGGGGLPWFNRSSSGHRGSILRQSIREASPMRGSIREGSVSRSSFTSRPLVSKTATEERKRHGREVEDRLARHGSVVEVPVDPKHWLLQSLRLQDYELQELFDQMEGVPEMNAYDVTGVRESWNELDKRRTKLAPEVGMLVKDQALLDKVKNLLTRYIELQSAVMSKERQEGLTEGDDERDGEDLRPKSPDLFE